MAKKTIRAKGLNGEAGLLAAIIDQAVNDATGAAKIPDIADARAYFALPTYKHHMTALGLPGDWLPAEFEQCTKQDFMS